MKREKNNIICVYFHINPLKNEVFYVGIGNIKRPYTKAGRNVFWNNTVDKYKFIVDVVHINLSWEEACKLEKFYIKFIGRRDLKLGTLVNLTDGGDGNNGLIMSKETKSKMSNSKMGRVTSQETIIKIIESNRGKLRSLESRNNISNAKKGKPTSQAAIEGMRKSNIGNKYNLGKVQSKEVIEKRVKTLKKSILQYDMNNNFIKEWDSASSAVKELKISSGGLSSCCKGNKRYSHVGGYKWKFKI